MHTLAINLKGSIYYLSYVKGQPVEEAKKLIREARKDDPTDLITLTDDFSQEVDFAPVDLTAFFSYDSERTDEVIIQNKLGEVKRNIELQQRANGDARIKTAAMNIPPQLIAAGQA